MIGTPWEVPEPRKMKRKCHYGTYLNQPCPCATDGTPLCKQSGPGLRTGLATSLDAIQSGNPKAEDPKSEGRPKPEIRECLERLRCVAGEVAPNSAFGVRVSSGFGPSDFGS